MPKAQKPLESVGSTILDSPDLDSTLCGPWSAVFPDLDSTLCGPWSVGCCVHSALAGSMSTGSLELGRKTASVWTSCLFYLDSSMNN